MGASQLRSTAYEAASPVPVSVITAVPLVEDVLVMVSSPVAEPVALGSNSTPSVAVCPGASVTGSLGPDERVKPVPVTVAELTVTNPGSEFEEYRNKVPATVAAYGGRFLARGGDPTVIEGDDPAGRVVILEFESRDRAVQWYNSVEYQAILPLRLRNSTGRVTCSTGT